MAFDMTTQLPNLKAWRENAGLTQEYVAHKLDIAVRSWIRWEKGEGKPDKRNRKVLDRLIARHPGVQTDVT